MSELRPWVAPREINAEAARDLARLLREWRQLLQYGPVPGAYQQLVFRRHVPAGLATISVAHRIPMSGQLRLLDFAAWTNTGQLTIQLHTQAGQVLAATQAVTSTPVRLTSPSAFARLDIARDQDLWLQIVSIDSGTPAELVVRLGTHLHGPPT